MPAKRPYPETWTAVPHRASRVATLPNGELAVLCEPGFEHPDRVILHLCASRPVREGFDDDGLLLIGPRNALFPCESSCQLVAGVWCDGAGRLWLAWSDGKTVSARRTRGPVRDLHQLRMASNWAPIAVPRPAMKSANNQWHLGSGGLRKPGEEELLLAALELPAGRIHLMNCGETSGHAVLHSHPLNHAPSLAIDPDSARCHAVWTTEDLRICYREVDLAALAAGTIAAAEPMEVWSWCHHPDVASNGRQVIVSYTDHMQYIKYGFFDGQQWQLDKHLNTLHPRFKETLSHSSWFWTDHAGVIHLSFVCLTRCLVYDSRWLGDGFSDPQPVEGLFHPSLYQEETRVKAERMSLDRKGGAMILSSSFLPERHGVYVRSQRPVILKPGEPLLFLDMEEVAEANNFVARLETMKPEPATPVLEPTGSRTDFDGARVLNGGTVLLDGDRYRMWYAAVARDEVLGGNWYDHVYVGYAESEDGLAWKRVPTGANLTFRGHPAPNLIRGVEHNACVFIDPADIPSRRYKAVNFEMRSHRYDAVKATGQPGYLGLPRRGWLATSPDGFNWKREEIAVDFPGTEPYSATPQKALYDPDDPDPNRRYKAIGWSALASKRRGTTMAYSPDCRHWTVAERSPLLDSMAAVTPIRPAGPYAQIHDASMYRIGRYLLAFYGYQFDGETADIRLAVSRDGAHFNFVFPETPLIARAKPGAWNSGYFLPADLVIDGDTAAFFYGSSAIYDDKHVPEEKWLCCAGRAVCRRDRFVCLSHRDAGRASLLMTVPLEVPAGRLALRVNAKLAKTSRLRVGLTHPDLPFKPLPGFATEDCTPIGGDSLSHPVRWQRADHIPADFRHFRISLLLEGETSDALYGVTFETAGTKTQVQKIDNGKTTVESDCLMLRPDLKDCVSGRSKCTR